MLNNAGSLCVRTPIVLGVQARTQRTHTLRTCCAARIHSARRWQVLLWEYCPKCECCSRVRCVCLMGTRAIRALAVRAYILCTLCASTLSVQLIYIHTLTAFDVHTHSVHLLFTRTLYQLKVNTHVQDA